ncbi:hypothetical protein CAT7_00880 [Carnobacterium sp. AT7]|uniref:RNA-directed DNA polymerase n=1 Tax=Carnobacterium sp. AT7 TaxID=333990 RepID=UPI00015F17E7|nr:RNA-directed DNA polymerase [Carnobacterium sp. AT7]EDP68069.1 hypothetical protein CAT7_00880 [Carnobacterium sp. AT7]
MSTQAEYYEALSETGMFMDSIPEEFNSKMLYKADTTKKLTNTNGNWTELIKFSIPKFGNIRRNGSVPNAYSYLQLCKVISEEWNDIENNHFNTSEYSLTTPVLKIVEEDKVITTKHKYSEMKERAIDFSSRYKYVVKLDINSYYPSIYTHAISWAIHTKIFAKENMRDTSLSGNKIDKAVRNMQSGQTMGIPIGPITSNFLHEIIGVAIDQTIKQIGAEKSITIVGSRYTDDMEFYFNKEEDATWFIRRAQVALKEYELELNSEKSIIERVPIVLEKEHIFSINSFRFRNYLYGNRTEEETTDLLMKMQKKDIMSFFNMVFTFYKKNPSKGMLKYAIKYMSHNIIYKENWHVVQSLLMQCVIVDSSTIGIVLELIEGYYLNDYISREELMRLKSFLNDLLKEHLLFQNHYEASQILSFCRKMKILINEENTKALEMQDNSIICILTMNLKKHDLLSNFDESSYINLLPLATANNQYWLFAYEAKKNKWFSNLNNITVSFPTNSIFYMDLLSNDVSFFETEKNSILEKFGNSLARKITSNTNYDQTNIDEIISDYISDLQNSDVKSIYTNIADVVKFKINEQQKLIEEVESKIIVDEDEGKTVEIKNESKEDIFWMKFFVSKEGERFSDFDMQNEVEYFV